jgi:hypothetical protein
VLALAACAGGVAPASAREPTAVVRAAGVSAAASDHRIVEGLHVRARASQPVVWTVKDLLPGDWFDRPIDVWIERSSGPWSLLLAPTGKQVAPAAPAHSLLKDAHGLVLTVDDCAVSWKGRASALTCPQGQRSLLKKVRYSSTALRTVRTRIPMVNVLHLRVRIEWPDDATTDFAPFAGQQVRAGVVVQVQV